MKYLIAIGCWMVEVLLLTTILVSMDYTFMQAMMLASMFLPVLLAMKYFLPQIHCRNCVSVPFALGLGISVADVLPFLDDELWRQYAIGIAEPCVSGTYTGGTLCLGHFDWKEARSAFWQNAEEYYLHLRP